MEQSNAQHIATKLDELAEIKAAADVTRLDYEAKRAEILKPSRPNSTHWIRLSTIGHWRWCKIAFG